jgi:6-phosphogluconolactonase (cycloisomerase 2 family)
MRAPAFHRRDFLVRAAAALPLAAGGSAALASRRAAASAADAPLLAYVGTFSSPLKDTLPTQVDLPPGNGQGIHRFTVDRESGAWTEAGITESGTSPSCLAVNAAGTRLYSAHETDRVGPGKHGSVAAWSIDRTTGDLTLLGSVASGGAGPTYVSLHPDGRHLFVANYFGGSVAVLPVRADGSLGEASDVKEDSGEIGPTRAQNAPPGSFAFSGHDRTHAHQILPSPDGRHVLHVDLGLDRIFVWRFDASKGTLSPGQHHVVAFPPGDGPRHFHFSPDAKRLYSIQEEGSTVVTLDWEAATGRLTPKQTLSTLPRGFKGSNFCSEILVSSDGRHVYCGNRLHDSIGIFRVQADGTLEYRGEEWTRGNYPRSFSFTPDGRYLACCNQRDDNVAIFAVDADSGALPFTGNYAAVGNPSHVVFLDLAGP